MTDTVYASNVVEAAAMPDGAKSSPLKRALVYALLTAVSFIMLYPLLWMVSSSFKPENEIFATTSLIPQELTLNAYRRGWNGRS